MQESEFKSRGLVQSHMIFMLEKRLNSIVSFILFYFYFVCVKD